jgi:hypothetical protein
MFGGRIHSGYLKKKGMANAYAIQNIKTGKDIRVHNAGIEDERRTTLYSHHNWECITWQFIEVGDSTFLLKNLYTQKSFQPSKTPQEGVTLWQQPLGGSLQFWEFLKQADGTFFIKLKDTELYITISAEENHSDIILMPLQNSANQKWKLIPQQPIV